MRMCTAAVACIILLSSLLPIPLGEVWPHLARRSPGPLGLPGLGLRESPIACRTGWGARARRHDLRCISIHLRTNLRTRPWEISRARLTGGHGLLEYIRGSLLSDRVAVGRRPVTLRRPGVTAYLLTYLQAALSAPEGRAYAPPLRLLLRDAHLPFRGAWPRASPRVTKPGCGPTHTVNS